MITFYTGISGSGKSLKAVYDIYFEFLASKLNENNNSFLSSFVGKKENNNKYLYLCTNINGFAFDLSEKFYPLDFQELYNKLKTIYLLYLAHNDDNILIEKAKELNIYKTLFVFDECHNYFKDKKDDVLVWWLTYHRHLYHDIVLITQDMSLVSKEYKSQGEQFYRAIPQTFRLRKDVFKYSLYSSFNMYQKDFIKAISIKPTKEIFDLYVSGNFVNSKSILKKYLFIAFMSVLIAIFTFIYGIFNFTSNENIQKKENISDFKKDITEIKKDNKVIENIDDLNTENLKLYKIRIFGNFCQIEFNNNTYEIPLKFFKLLVTDINKDYVYTDLKQINLIYILADKNFFNFLINEEKENKKNEKNNSNFNILGK